jgi:hypothetical protein
MRKTSESSIKRHLKELTDNKCIVSEYNKRNDRRITPNIFPSLRENIVRNEKIVQFTHIDDETNDALDDLYKRIKVPTKKKSK